MDTTTKIFIKRIQTDEEFRTEFIDTLMFWKKNYGIVERNRMHYIVFTPMWKQLWHKIIGKKPYERADYKPTI